MGRPGRRAVAGLAALLALAAAAAFAPAAPAKPAAKPAARAADPADLALYEQLGAQVLSLWDGPRGGFVRKNGTPCEAAVELALARGEEGDTLALARALATLRWMHALLDTVGGGYFESVRDADRMSVSFEKRTDSNLRRLGLLARVAGRKGETFERDGRRVADYAERVLVDPAGGFVTSQVGSRDLEPESNGAALLGWWRWAVHTSDARRRDFAFRSLDRLWNDCRESDLGLVRRDKWGKVREPSLLPDQAEMGRAYLAGWQAAGRDSDLARARALGDHVLEHFEDGRAGGFRIEYAAERFGHARRIGRPYEDNAVAARFLAELGAATGDTTYTNAARRGWRAFAKQFDKPRLEAADWALAIRATWAPGALARGEWGPKAPAKKPATPAKARPAKKPVAKPKRP